MVTRVSSQELAGDAEGELDRIGLEIQRHLEVVADLFRQSALEITLRQAFKEGTKFFFTVRDEGEDSIQEASIGIDVIADFVDAAIEEV